MTFQENLRKYREAAGWKYARDFAEHVGIKYSTYIGYETQNREPKYEVLIQIAKALGVTTDDLLGYTGSEGDRFDAALRDLRASGFHDDYDQQVKNAFEMGLHPDCIQEINIFFGDSSESEEEYCFSCPPELLPDAYDFVHSSENEQAFNSLKFGLYIKAFFQYEIGKRKLMKSLFDDIAKNGTKIDPSSWGKSDNPTK